jgi:hypothetical protein
MSADCRRQAAEWLDLARQRRAGFRAAERNLLERAAVAAGGPEEAE